MATLAQKLPYTHPFAGGYPYRGSQRLPSDPDALTYLAAVAAADGAPVEVGVAVAVDDFFKGCKADGIWDAIKASCILCGARTLAGALVPLVGTAPTNYNFVDADYNRETGLVSDGSTKHLDSNRTSDTDPQDSFHVAVYASTVAGTGYAIATQAAETGRTTMGIGDLGSQVNRSSSVPVSPATPIGPGFIGQNRSASSAFTFRYLDSSASYSLVSQTPSSAKLLVFCRGLPGTPTAVTSSRLAFYSIGESLDLEALDTRVTALVTAIGAAL